MISEWQQRIADARATKQPLAIVGGNSKHFYGQTTIGQTLCTRGHTGIISYEPTELVITAKCGTPLAELEAVLAEHQQMLAFEPPHFGSATIGGCVAAGLSGPRRARAGSLRDFVLGAQLLDGAGSLLNFGGQVMKNVAGYDVSRFLAGSLGILGIITEVSLKVLPQPETNSSCRLECSQTEALQRMAKWAGLPLPISATAWHKGILHLRLSGADTAVTAARKHIGGSELQQTEAEQFWQDLKEQRLAFFEQPELPLWRLAVPANCPVMEFGQDQGLLEWNGTQRWLRGEFNATQLRQQTAAIGGHATLFRGGNKADGVFQTLSMPLLQLHKNLKRGFDPDAIFNTGRLYAAL